MNLFNTKFVKETEYAKEIKRLREQLESRDKTIESLSATISDLTKKLCYPVLNPTEPEVKKGRKKPEKINLHINSAQTELFRLKLNGEGLVN